jgi:hypothetical protein
MQSKKDIHAWAQAALMLAQQIREKKLENDGYTEEQLLLIRGAASTIRFSYKPKIIVPITLPETATVTDFIRYVCAVVQECFEVGDTKFVQKEQPMLRVFAKCVAMWHGSGILERVAH